MHECNARTEETKHCCPVTKMRGVEEKGDDLILSNRIALGSLLLQHYESLVLHHKPTARSQLFMLTKKHAL